MGREMVLPVDIMLEVGGGEEFTSVNAYVSRLMETLSTVVEAVKKHQAKASRQQKANFDLRVNFQYYSEGELVWVLDKSRKRGLCPKLQRRFKGPYKIMDRVTEVLYRVAPIWEGPEKVIHFNRLKPYLSSCPEPLPVQTDATPTPPGRQDVHPQQRRSGGTAALGLRQQSPPGGGVTRVQHPSASSEQGEEEPSSHLGAERDETLEGGADGVALDDNEEMDSSMLLETNWCLPGGGSCPGNSARGGHSTRERKAPVWLKDYETTF